MDSTRSLEYVFSGDTIVQDTEKFLRIFDDFESRVRSLESIPEHKITAQQKITLSALKNVVEMLKNTAKKFRNKEYTAIARELPLPEGFDINNIKSGHQVRRIRQEVRRLIAEELYETNELIRSALSDLSQSYGDPEGEDSY